MCILQFPEELLHLKAPFIKVGLEANEFCMWINGEPVTEKDAFKALQEVLPDAQIVLTNWVSKARHAEAKGFAGIRITGN